jgi:hypothetical protein
MSAAERGESECDLETSTKRSPNALVGLLGHKQKKKKGNIKK